jgi:hypothetical protein
MKEHPSAYIFESDGSVHRQRVFEDDEEPQELSPLDREGEEAVTAAR